MHNIQLLVMPLETIMADAVVTILPATLEWKGSLNQSLVRAAGEQLDAFMLEQVYRPRLGDVVILPGFSLLARHLILTITPEWKDSNDFEDRDLLRAYRRPIDLARRLGLKTLAFGALGTGKRAFPVRRAARLACQGIRERWYPELEKVQICCTNPEVIEIFAAELEQPG